jgi:hypothetical protein
MSLVSMAGSMLGGGFVYATDTSTLGPKITAEVQGEIVGQVLEGFAEAKFILSSNPDKSIITQVRECEGITCLQNLAKYVGSDLVVKSDVQIKKTGKKGKPDYNIALLVARNTPNRDSWHERIDCPDCDASEITHMASLMATTIGERIVKAAKATPSPVPAPEKPVAVAPSPPSAAVKYTALPPKPEWSVPRYVSIPVLATGLALVGTGIYRLHIDGQDSCSQRVCPRIYETASLGTPASSRVAVSLC